MVFNKIAYFNEDAAAGWVDKTVGKELANILMDKFSYTVVDYSKLIQVIKDAINGNARDYAIVFVNDVVPYELFNNDIDPMNSLLMRFIAKGGVVTWIGDVPF